MNIQKNVDILALKRLKVYGENQQEVLFSSFWEDSKVIFIFLRHFSCISCRAHVDIIWKRKKEFAKAKSRIVFIGNGDASNIKHFKEDIPCLDAEIYTDPTLETFKACNLINSESSRVSEESLRAIKILQKEGYKGLDIHDTNVAHDQMGGIVAFKSPGLVLYHYVSTYIGDFDDSEKWPS